MAARSRVRTSPKAKHVVARVHEPEHVLGVFISFANDVKTEANAAVHIVQLVSAAVGQRTGIALKSYLWDRDQPSSLGGADAQSLINEEMKKYTFFVGIMATRFGSPTPRAASGMEEEYEVAVHCKNAHRLPMFRLTYYFSTKRVNPAEIEIAQLALVQSFTERIAKQGLYHSFSSVGAFREQFREDLEKHVNDWHDHEQDRMEVRGHKQIRRDMAVRAGASAKDSRQALSAIEQAVVEAIGREDWVRLSGFGTFGVKETKAHKGVNPRTLKAMTIPKKKAPFFKPGKDLRDAVAKK